MTTVLDRFIVDRPLRLADNTLGTERIIFPEDDRHWQNGMLTFQHLSPTGKVTAEISYHGRHYPDAPYPQENIPMPQGWAPPGRDEVNDIFHPHRKMLPLRAETPVNAVACFIYYETAPNSAWLFNIIKPFNEYGRANRDAWKFTLPGGDLNLTEPVTPDSDTLKSAAREILQQSLGIRMETHHLMSPLTVYDADNQRFVHTFPLPFSFKHAGATISSPHESVAFGPVFLSKSEIMAGLKNDQFTKATSAILEKIFFPE